MYIPYQDMIVKPQSKQMSFWLFMIVAVMGLACESSTVDTHSLSIVQLYESANLKEQAIAGLETKPLLSKMQIHVKALQSELKSLDMRIEETKSARRTQTGIMLSDSIFERLIVEMSALQKVMTPLCKEFKGVSLPFDVKTFENESPDTEFGQPPLANQIILQQLSTDVQESERAILEAIIANKL